MFVVNCETVMQDSRENFAKVFDTIEEALKWVNDHADPWGAMNYFRLYKIGAEITIQSERVEVSKVVEREEKTVYSIAKGKKNASA